MNQNDSPANLNSNEGGKFLADLDKLPKPNLTGHIWRQEGNLLKCMSCPFNHASFIEPGYQLYEINEQGIPMFRKINVKN